MIQPTSAASAGIASTTTVTKQKVGAGLYALHFSIYYETIVGESIAVVGNLGELGKWKEYKCHLIWTEGHIWRSAQPIVVRESYFEYKYVLLENDKVVAWEEGVNRIADLDALPEVKDFKDIEMANSTPNMAKNNLNLNQQKLMLPDEYKNKQVKHCQFKDLWEQYVVRFSIFDPLYQKGDEMYLQPSSLSGMDSIRMQRASTSENWLTAKYGKPIQIWHCDVSMKNMNGDSEGQYLQGSNVCFQYSYVKRTAGQFNNSVTERQPERCIYLRDPKTY